MEIACCGDLRARWTRDGQAFPCLHRCPAAIGAVGLSFYAGSVQIAEKAMDVRADGLRAMLAAIQDKYTQIDANAPMALSATAEPCARASLTMGLDMVRSGQLARARPS